MTFPETPLKQTPLNAAHRALGAKMVPFGGWDMPVQYRGILEEHRAVRSVAGLFDVCHMGEVEFRGAGALPALQRLTSNDVSRLQIGQIQYSALTTAAGTFVDDLTVYRLADDAYLTTLNASNIEKDVRWMREHSKAVEIVDQSEETGLVAIQGPRALEILQTLTPVNLAAIPYYWCAQGTVAGEEAL
ncbi:MAG: gcvT, partial [candidate division NC10 bacterium]|nr:gcvT [candidate division NC10 bacterium]